MSNSDNSKLVISDAPATTVLTVYQHGPAVVNESRVVSLEKGRSNVQLDGLPLTFVSGSLSLDKADGPGKFTLHTSTFREATLTTENILAKSVGKDVCVIEQTRHGEVHHRGTLLYIIDGHTAVLEVATGTAGKKVHLVNLTGQYDLMGGIPEGLSPLSSLVMDVSATKNGDYNLASLYEAENLQWRPWYEFILDRDSGKLERLACYVELTNESGTDMNDATLSLIAGANHSVNAQAKNRGFERGGVRMAAMAPQAMTESAGGGMDYQEADVENVGDQPMYTLPDAVTLVNGETQNPALVFAQNVDYTQELHLHGGHGYYWSGDAVDVESLSKTGLKVRLRVRNVSTNSLGVPLPPAQGRVLERDSRGNLQKTDKTGINGHVAAKEEFELWLEKLSKGVKASRQLTFQHIDPEPPEEDESAVDEGGLPDDDAPRMRPMNAAAEVEPSVGATVIDDGKQDRIRRSIAKKPKEKKKPEPRFQEEERVIRVYNYGDEPVDNVFIHENVPVNAQWLTGTGRNFNRMNENNSAGHFQVIVPKSEGEQPGMIEVRYRIKWQIN